MTLAGLPRAGTHSKPHDYIQNVQEKKGFPKTWVLTGKQFDNFKAENQTIQSSHGEQNERTTRPQGENLNMNHVAEKKLNEAKLKKAFRIKLFELCKTRTKRSSPDLFNFCVISTGLDMTNDAGRATTCRRSFKATWLQTERTKNEGPSGKKYF